MATEVAADGTSDVGPSLVATVTPGPRQGERGGSSARISWPATRRPRTFGRVLGVANQDDVRRIALALPGVTEHKGPHSSGFSVGSKGKQKGLVWVWRERVDPKKPRVPNPDVLVVRVAD